MNVVFVIFLSFLSIVSSHVAINELTPDYHSNDIRLPGVMNAIVSQLTALRILKNDFNEYKNNNIENKIETIFLVMSYTDYLHHLMVLTEEGEYYIVTGEKTYNVSMQEEYSTLQQQYKFLYYENLSEDSMITLEDVEDYMTQKDNII